MACDELLKSDMDQSGFGEEYGLLRKLIKKPHVVHLYETIVIRPSTYTNSKNIIIFHLKLPFTNKGKSEKEDHLSPFKNFSYKI